MKRKRNRFRERSRDSEPCPRCWFSLESRFISEIVLCCLFSLGTDMCQKCVDNQLTRTTAKYKFNYFESASFNRSRTLHIKSLKPSKMRFENGKTSTRKTENLAHMTYPNTECGKNRGGHLCASVHEAMTLYQRWSLVLDRSGGRHFK